MKRRGMFVFTDSLEPFCYSTRRHELIDNDGMAIRWLPKKQSTYEIAGLIQPFNEMERPLCVFCLGHVNFVGLSACLHVAQPRQVTLGNTDVYKEFRYVCTPCYEAEEFENFCMALAAIGEHAASKYEAPLSFEDEVRLAEEEKFKQAVIQRLNEQFPTPKSMPVSSPKYDFFAMAACVGKKRS